MTEQVEHPRDKVVPIIGVGRSIGLRCTRQGATVLLAGRNNDALEHVAAEAPDVGGRALPVPLTSPTTTPLSGRSLQPPTTRSKQSMRSSTAAFPDAHPRSGRSPPTSGMSPSTSTSPA